MGLTFCSRLVSCRPSQLSTLVHPIVDSQQSRYQRCRQKEPASDKDLDRRTFWRPGPIVMTIDSMASYLSHVYRCLPFYLPFAPSIGTDSTKFYYASQSFKTAYYLKEWDFEDVDLLNLDCCLSNPQQIPLWLTSCCASQWDLSNQMSMSSPFGSIKLSHENCQPFGQVRSQRKNGFLWIAMLSLFKSSKKIGLVHSLDILGTDLCHLCMHPGDETTDVVVGW